MTAGYLALERVTDAWQNAPVACQLSEKVVSGIIQRARETAAAAFPRQSRTVRAVAGAHPPCVHFSLLLLNIEMALICFSALYVGRELHAQCAAIPHSLQNLPSIHDHTCCKQYCPVGS
jgi:hypothetical protein